MLATDTYIHFSEFESHAPTTVYNATELLAEYGDVARLLTGTKRKNNRRSVVSGGAG